MNLKSSTNLLGKTLRQPANGSRNGALLAAPLDKSIEGFTLLLYSPVGLDPKLVKRALKDSLK